MILEENERKPITNGCNFNTLLQNSSLPSTLRHDILVLETTLSEILSPLSDIELSLYVKLVALKLPGHIYIKDVFHIEKFVSSYRVIFIFFIISVQAILFPSTIHKYVW
jgi:hypothetical protein